MKTLRRDVRARAEKQNGFSLIEMMIVIAIIALLVALALPSYKQFIRKGHRGDAQKQLLNYANLQEIWRSNNTTYAPAASLTLPTHDYYTFTLRAAGTTCGTNTAPTATDYIVLACAKTGTDQVNDKQGAAGGAVTCSPMTLDSDGAKTPAACW